MRVADAFLAEWAQLLPGGRVDARGIGLDTLPASTFPSRHEYLALVLRLEFSASEGEQTHPLRIELLDPDGYVADQVNGEIVPPINPRERYRPSVVPIVWHLRDFSLPAPGDYAFHVLVHDLEFAVVSLFVRQVV